jgi:hypothetical protein
MPSHETQAGTLWPALALTASLCPARARPRQRKGAPQPASKPHTTWARSITPATPTSHQQPPHPRGRITAGVRGARPMVNANTTAHGHRTGRAPAEIPPRHGPPTPRRRSSDRSAEYLRSDCPKTATSSLNVSDRPMARTHRMRRSGRLVQPRCSSAQARRSGVICAPIRTAEWLAAGAGDGQAAEGNPGRWLMSAVWPLAHRQA